MSGGAAALVLAVSVGTVALPGAEPGPFVFPDSDTEPIEKRRLLDLDLTTLWQARNEIYARKGWRFKTRRAQRFFGAKSYYQPATAEVVLSPVEKDNVALLRRFERYLIENEDREFESLYSVWGGKEPTDLRFSVRACASEDCAEVGHLREGCLVANDYRMDEGDWVYVLSSRCDGVRAELAGYVPRRWLRLEAG